MAVPDKAAVLEAMRSDLGVGRVDDLDLAVRPGSSVRPGQAGRIVAIPPPPPKRVLPIANKWKDAIARGEFDDEDADAVKNLDKIGGGRLHALNKPPSGMNNFAVRPPPAFSSEKLRMPGAYPPTPEKSIRGAPNGRQNSSIGVSSMGYVPNGPVHRFTTGSSPARQFVQNAQQRPLPMRTPQAFQARPLQRQPNALPPSPMPPTPPRDVAAEPQMETRPKDPEPLEYFHKADIRVGDRLAKGRGTVYLLESSPTDTGTISIYLEGSKYLEYPVLSMYNYITNSEELCPQFKEPDGVSITTTSLVFGSQEKMVTFMKAFRTLKARKSSSPSKPASTSKPQTNTEPRAKAGDSTQQKIPASAVPAKGPVIEDGRGHDIKNSLTDANKRGDQQTTADTERPQPVPHPRQTEAPPTRQIANEKPLVEEAPTKPADCEVTNDLLDLSLPSQAPSGRVTHASQFSTYAVDLGSLELPVCISAGPETEAEKGETHASPTVDTPTEANVPGASTETTVEAPLAHNAIVLADQDASQTDQDPGQTSQDVQQINQEIEQMTHVQLVHAIENIRGYLLSILPTFEDMCRVLVSVDAADRQIVAKTIYASIRDSSHEDVAESEASAKQVLLALLSQAGQVEKRKTIEARPDNRTKYTPGEILQLRTKALPPPPQLSKFTDILRTEKLKAPQPAPTADKKNVPSREQNINPKKNPAVPPPRAVPGHKRGASSQSNIIKIPGSFNPEAPAFTGSNVENITAALAAVSLTGEPTETSPVGNPASPSVPKSSQENKKPDPPAVKQVKGLSGSRWATDSAVLPTSASRFTGINIP